MGSAESVPAAYRHALASLDQQPRRWAITGAAGFVGSNLLETLLRHGQHVTGLDNFMTGYRENLEQVRALVPRVSGLVQARKSGRHCACFFTWARP